MALYTPNISENLYYNCKYIILSYPFQSLKRPLLKLVLSNLKRLNPLKNYLFKSQLSLKSIKRKRSFLEN